MKTFQRVLSSIVLVCFVFNTAVSDIALSQPIAPVNAHTLAARSMFDPLDGSPMTKDVNLVRTFLSARLLRVFNTSANLQADDILNALRSMENNAATNEGLPGHSVFNPATFLTDSAELVSVDGKTMVHVRCRVVDGPNSVNERAYHQIFPPLCPTDTNFGIAVFNGDEYRRFFKDGKCGLPFERLLARDQRDLDAIKCDSRHQEYDKEVLDVVYSDPSIPKKTLTNYPQIVDEILRAACIEVVNDNPALKNIGERIFTLIPITSKVRTLLEAHKLLVRVQDEKEPVEVIGYAHSSNHAVTIFMEESDIDLLMRSADATSSEYNKAKNKLTATIAYEIGVMLGLQASGFDSDGFLVNNVRDRYAIEKSSVKTYTLVDLDKAYDRDHAMGDTSNGAGRSAVVVLGKSPADACKVIARARLFGVFTLKDYMSAYEKYAKELGFEPNISKSIALRDLLKSSNSLVHQGILRVINEAEVKAGKEKAYRFLVTEKGLRGDELRQDKLQDKGFAGLRVLASQLQSAAKNVAGPTAKPADHSVLTSTELGHHPDLKYLAPPNTGYWFDGTYYPVQPMLIPKDSEGRVFSEEELFETGTYQADGQKRILVENDDIMTWESGHILASIMDAARFQYSFGLATGGTTEALRKMLGMAGMVKKLYGRTIDIGKITKACTLDNYYFNYYLKRWKFTDVEIEKIIAVASYEAEQKYMMLDNMFGPMAPDFFVAPPGMTDKQWFESAEEFRKLLATGFWVERFVQLWQLHGIGTNSHDAFNEVYELVKLDRSRVKFELDRDRMVKHAYLAEGTDLAKLGLTHMPEFWNIPKQFSDMGPMRDDHATHISLIVMVQNVDHFLKLINQILAKRGDPRAGKFESFHPFFLKYMGDNALFNVDQLITSILLTTDPEKQLLHYTDNEKYHFKNMEHFTSELQFLFDMYDAVPREATSQGTGSTIARGSIPLPNGRYPLQLIMACAAHKQLAVARALALPSPLSTSSTVLHLAKNALLVATEESLGKVVDPETWHTFIRVRPLQTGPTDDLSATIERVWGQTPPGQATNAILAGGRVAEPTAPAGDAIMADGTALVGDLNAQVNGAVKEAFEAKEALEGGASTPGLEEKRARLAEDVKLPEGYEMWIIPGLKDIPELIAHPGRGGEALSHTKKRIYVSQERYAWFKDLQTEWPAAAEQYIAHEVGHIDVKNAGANLTEEEVQTLYPINLVLAEEKFRNPLVEGSEAVVMARVFIEQATKQGLAPVVGRVEMIYGEYRVFVAISHPIDKEKVLFSFFSPCNQNNHSYMQFHHYRGGDEASNIVSRDQWNLQDNRDIDTLVNKILHNLYISQEIIAPLATAWAPVRQALHNRVFFPPEYHARRAALEKLAKDRGFVPFLGYGTLPVFNEVEKKKKDQDPYTISDVAMSGDKQAEIISWFAKTYNLDAVTTLMDLTLECEAVLDAYMTEEKRTSLTEPLVSFENLPLQIKMTLSEAGIDWRNLGTIDARKVVRENGRIKHTAAALEQLKTKIGPEKPKTAYVIMPFTLTHYLMGDDALIAAQGMLSDERKQEFDAIMAYAEKITAEHAKYLIESGADAITGLDPSIEAINPAFATEYSVVYMNQLTRVVRGHGALAFYHFCRPIQEGNAQPMLDHTKYADVDGLSIDAMYSLPDVFDQLRAAGSRAVIMGNIDTRGLLPFASSDQVARAVDALHTSMGARPFLCATSCEMLQISSENMRALADAAAVAKERARVRADVRTGDSAALTNEQHARYEALKREWPAAAEQYIAHEVGHIEVKAALQGTGMELSEKQVQILYPINLVLAAEKLEKFRDSEIYAIAREGIEELIKQGAMPILARASKSAEEDEVSISVDDPFNPSHRFVIVIKCSPSCFSATLKDSVLLGETREISSIKYREHFTGFMKYDVGNALQPTILPWGNEHKRMRRAISDKISRDKERARVRSGINDVYIDLIRTGDFAALAEAGTFTLDTYLNKRGYDESKYQTGLYELDELIASGTVEKLWRERQALYRITEYGKSRSRGLINLVAQKNDRIARDIEDARDSASRAGELIPAAEGNQYTLLVTDQFYANGEFEADKAQFRQRFALDKIDTSSPTTSKKPQDVITGILKSDKVRGNEKKVVVLIENTTPPEELNRLKEANIRYILADPAELLNGKLDHETHDEKALARRLQFREETYMTMLLARGLNDDADAGSPIERTLEFYVRTHFMAKGSESGDEHILSTVAARDYIDAIRKGDANRIAKAYLAYRPAKAYDIPEYKAVTAAMISA